VYHRAHDTHLSARKDELIDLMVDEVIAGALLDEIPHDWRDALSAIARL
jgi:hypothetical protein